MSDTTRPKIDAAVPVWTCLCLVPVLAIYFPRSLAYVPLLIGVAGALWWVLQQKQAFVFSKFYLIVIGVIGGLWLASCLWSVDRAGSFEEILSTYPILLFGVIAFSLSQILPFDKARHLFGLLPFCLGFSALVISVELYFDLPLYRLIRGAVEGQKFSTAVMNRSILAIVLTLPIAYYALKHWSVIPKIKIITAVFMILCVSLMLILTQSQSAQLAAFLILFCLFLFPVSNNKSYSVLFSIILFFFVFAPWISIWIFQEFAEKSVQYSWLKNGFAAHRMEIWSFVSEKILQNPFYGFGFEATKLIGAFDHVPVYQKTNTLLHPHNFALQIWIEFGLLGVVPACVLLFLLLKSMREMPVPATRVCLAVFVGTLGVAAITYGLWQSWWLGLFIYLLVLCNFVGAYEKKLMKNQ